jgi:hypothetical protein
MQTRNRTSLKPCSSNIIFRSYSILNCLVSSPSVTKTPMNAASSEHSKMRVVCPWCYGEEKTYQRMSELQKHTEKRHQSLTDDVKTSSFFSETNGFWLYVGCSWICFLDLSCVFHPSSHCCLDLLDVPVRSSHRLTASLVLNARIVS